MGRLTTSLGQTGSSTIKIFRFVWYLSEKKKKNMHDYIEVAMLFSLLLYEYGSWLSSLNKLFDSSTMFLDVINTIPMFKGITINKDENGIVTLRKQDQDMFPTNK